VRARSFALAVLVLAGCAHSNEVDPRPVRSSITIERPEKPHREEGLATWYGKEQHGGPTASGERFDMHAMTAAHKKLRMQTRVRVTNKLNGKSVVLRINDRGPYARGRIIDVSYAAARVLDMIDRGVVPVLVEVLP
jgi:rare lipoprotein A